MTKRKPPVELMEAKLRARLLRSSGDERGDRLTSIPTRRRPSLVLVAERPEPGAPDLPEPGTLRVVDGVPVLYVGRDWCPARGEVTPLAESLLGRPVVGISGYSIAATQRARKRLRIAWRVEDCIRSGLYDAEATQRLRDVQKGL